MAEFVAAAADAAVFRALRADARLIELFGGDVRVHDITPHAAAFPYIVRDAWQEIFEGSDDFEDRDVVGTFSVFDRPEPPSDGAARCQRIAARVEAVLRDLTITLTDHRLVDADPEGILHIADPDPNTRHSIVNVRWLTAPL